MSDQNKNVLIVGGGTGIGAACALLLAENGFRVAISGRRENKLKETAGQSGKKILYSVADVSNRDQVNNLIQWAEKEMGSIDIMVNSAGVNIPNRSMKEPTPQYWDFLLKVNATGAYNCMHAVLPSMLKQKDGLIINISSVAGIRAGMLGGVAYNASKFAMSALGISVAQEVKDDGIRVTTIYPGEVETPILDNRPVPVSKEQRAKILQPEDLAQAVLMIANLHPRAHVSELVIKPTTQVHV
jgi:NADP-dependent 3-hydroxy acid dehydrogenase YdfG